MLKRRKFSVDDGFLLLGTSFLIGAVILFFLYVDTMYITEALVLGLPNVTISPNFIKDSMWFHNMSIASLILSWWSLIAVKLCFLFLFKDLVQGLKQMLVYWWVTTIFNIVVAFFGTAMYIAACPHFNNSETNFTETASPID